MTPGHRIRITDLREPRLTEVQRLALEYGDRNPVELTEESVLGSAVERTGLDDFGPDDFRARLRLWLEEVDADPERSGLGRLTLFRDCVRYASNRLRIRDLLAAHPEILEVEIAAPIIVVGLPRSGTTHLVNLIAADTRLRSLPLWESYEPVPGPGDPGAPDGADPRYRRAEEDWRSMEAMLPHLAVMHPMRPDHVHEELELQLPDFSSYQLEWVARVPRWRDYYLSHDQTPHYRVSEDGAPDPAAAASRRTLGAQVAAAPRTAGPAARYLPRLHRGRDASRSGVGGAVRGDDDGLRSPHELPEP